MDPGRPHRVGSQSNFIDGHKGNVARESAQVPENVLQRVLLMCGFRLFRRSSFAVWRIKDYGSGCIFLG
jgi:hypothetical protein